MYLDDEQRAEPEYLPGECDEDEPMPTRRRFRRGKRAIGWLVALGLILGMAAGAWFGIRGLFGFEYPDYAGAGTADVIIQVNDGDSTTVIANTLFEADVVASSRAFLAAAENNADARGIRPGYYLVKTEMSGAHAVDALTDPATRVGEVQLRAGSQLDDVELPDGSASRGILSELARASCADLNGGETCVSADELRSAAADADLTELGVPAELATRAEKADPQHRLEGLIMPGIYDIQPGWSVEEILREVLSTSATRLEAAGLPESAEQTGLNAYQVVVIASIIEREAVKQDFGKVSRVIYNRLAKDMRLEMDSTINYALERPHIRTSGSDRRTPGPYNTYLNTKLTPTPIASPSPEAIEAALNPEPGKWVYFVKCEENGLSCFTEEYADHQRNSKDARERGVW